MADVLTAVIGLFVMLSAPTYFILQPWSAITLGGGWRIAAVLPLVPAIPLLAWCAYAFADQSTLWPLPFLLFAPFATLYLAILLAAARMSRDH